MARFTAHRLTQIVHPFFRLRLSRVPIYLIIVSTIASIYYLTADASSHPAFSQLDQHLRDWKRYPNERAVLV